MSFADGFTGCLDGRLVERVNGAIGQEPVGAAEVGEGAAVPLGCCGERPQELTMWHVQAGDDAGVAVRVVSVAVGRGRGGCVAWLVDRVGEDIREQSRDLLAVAPGAG